MRKTEYKVFMEWQLEEEEAWLNSMADKGWNLVKAGNCKYVFEPCEPGEYSYKAQVMNDFLSAKKNQEYISFVEETGAEVAGKFLYGIYFRKKRSEGDFELFSDNVSRIKHISTIFNILLVLGMLNIVLGIMNLILALITMLPLSFATAGLGALVGIACLFGAHKINNKKKALKADEGILDK